MLSSITKDAQETLQQLRDTHQFEAYRTFNALLVCQSESGLRKRKTNERKNQAFSLSMTSSVRL